MTTINKTEYDLLDAAAFTGCAFLEYEDPEEYALEHYEPDEVDEFDAEDTIKAIADFNDFNPTEGKLTVTNDEVLSEMEYYLDSYLEVLKEEIKCPEMKRVVKEGPNGEAYLDLMNGAKLVTVKVIANPELLTEQKKQRSGLYRLIRKLNNAKE